MAKGCLIVCDGNNGAGKSSVIRAINEFLISQNYQVLITREPGGTPIGEKIRAVVLDPETPELCDTTELLLFAAARAQHLKEKIIPAIEAGKVVVCDRFTPATVAFQHYGRGISLDVVQKINSFALDGFAPDLNIILDVDPEIGMKRVASRGEGLDRMEMQKLGFLARAREGFLRQAEEDPYTFVVIDASEPFDAVCRNVMVAVSNLLVERG
ncbi:MULTISPECIES: dTMP kinase [Pseudomonas syringae group genomosp. 2]|uniref:Thymidylate kinase n=4 Tax=Pseudomonas syringae group genomosp. 2 TaxID=251698 RepID=A0AAX1VUJ1_PSEAJ|nr:MULTISPECIES: dTMP kinase [Pseudomonas syringae group genomosp. 2]KEZ27683.1 thymidylate kinase [Pseudomonas amygdali pv. tabaci str. 6605]KPX63099.1 Thymidylate kinase [Pseudomonas amygdali pv. lachrymans]KIY17372.1 thymidylate kinase [Pseudomonas amygdali pv. tabaci]KPY83097.1 Thymidylate kinase [Pseudomonas amygdali pv. tabaci]QOI03999.1 dTMP kinase [Pseudomonas savastanoi]